MAQLRPEIEEKGRADPADEEAPRLTPGGSRRR